MLSKNKSSLAIEVSNLSKNFGHKQALSKVTFTVPQGSIFGFLGPNGAGKTTTIRCLMDFDEGTNYLKRIYFMIKQFLKALDYEGELPIIVPPEGIRYLTDCSVEDII